MLSVKGQDLFLTKKNSFGKLDTLANGLLLSKLSFSGIFIKEKYSSYSKKLPKGKLSLLKKEEEVEDERIPQMVNYSIFKFGKSYFELLDDKTVSGIVINDTSLILDAFHLKIGDNLDKLKLQIPFSFKNRRKVLDLEKITVPIYINPTDKYSVNSLSIYIKAFKVTKITFASETD